MVATRSRTRSTSSDPIQIDRHDEEVVTDSVKKVSRDEDFAVDKRASPTKKKKKKTGKRQVDVVVQADNSDSDDGEGGSSSIQRSKESLKKHPSTSDKDADGKLSGGNELSKLIPGYTAPRKLNTSSLDRYRPTGGIAKLRQQAQKTDASTREFVIGSQTSKNHIVAMTSKKGGGQLPTSYTQAYASFKKGMKRNPDLTAGKGWFNMKPTAMTNEIKTDISIIQNRSYLDPKRFYKRSDKFKAGGIIQHGTVIEGSTEFYSSRLTNKQRRTNLTEEIMADPESANYAKDKFKRMQQDKTHQAKQRQKQFNKNKKRKRGHF